MSIPDLLVVGVVRNMRVGASDGDDCYGCGENDRMMKDCPKEKDNVMGGKQVAISDVEDVPSKRNRFYSLRSKGYQE